MPIYNPGNNVIVNFIMRFPKLATAAAIVGVATPAVIEHKAAEKPADPAVVQPAPPAPVETLPVTVKKNGG